MDAQLETETEINRHRCVFSALRTFKISPSYDVQPEYLKDVDVLVTMSSMKFAGFYVDTTPV